MPGGWFTRGVDEDPHTCEQADQPRDGRSSVQPAAEVWVDSFYMDLTEVTNLAYQACVRARDCEAAGPLYRDYDADTQPITGMNWFQARDFCQGRGMRLPTDAEFELASRGPDGEMYPWGNEPADCERAIIMNEEGRACGVPKRGSHPDTGRIFEVASRPAGRYGLFDLSGNAEEWVNDWWSGDYTECGDACLGANPMGPCDGADECRGHRYKSIRGGSWYWTAEHAHGAHRRRYEPDNDPAHHFGFRCAVLVVDHASAATNAAPNP
ncbi:MAG: sulfatase activating formylglycine-generating enzyme [Bradymonadia bacterium]